jgi:hypothetical protein
MDTKSELNNGLSGELNNGNYVSGDGDRFRIVRIRGGAQAQSTCQVLSVSLPLC